MDIQTEIITIGDEILIGQIVDTNSAWMATELNKHGFSVKQITSVHDDADHIMQALDDGLKRAQVVLITGGLGPTKDDITKQTLCRYFHTELIHDASVHQHIHELYAARPDVLNRLTESQSLVPAGCTVIQNDVGSA
ncbi:MAG: competence/damage-inducible protein A, partial [Paludibacteraceae bacterium]|nr:competence/damage-inducible protein A [Paludibacteraceae bacterium]